jgi:hypothetical protein
LIRHETRVPSAAGLDLEKDDVVDRADAFVRGVRVGELLGGLPEQGIVDLVERGARRGGLASGGPCGGSAASGGPAVVAAPPATAKPTLSGSPKKIRVRDPHAGFSAISRL